MSRALDQSRPRGWGSASPADLDRPAEAFGQPADESGGRATQANSGTMIGKSHVATVALINDYNCSCGYVIQCMILVNK